MNAFTMVSIIFLSVFGMITVVACRVSANHARVKIAQAQNGGIVLHADADTGEVLEESQARLDDAAARERLEAALSVA